MSVETIGSAEVCTLLDSVIVGDMNFINGSFHVLQETPRFGIALLVC